jgi:hypothetical protein
MWNGRSLDGRDLGAGVYLVRAETTAGPRFRRLVRISH